MNPLGLNHRRIAAKITESRKRTLFPSDAAAEQTRPRRTMNPPSKSSPNESESASASVSKTHGKEPDTIPIHLRSFGSPQSRGSRPAGPSDDSPARERWVPSPRKISPGRGDRSPPPHEHQHPLPSPAPDDAPEHESEKPQSFEAAKVSAWNRQLEPRISPITRISRDLAFHCHAPAR